MAELLQFPTQSTFGFAHPASSARSNDTLGLSDSEAREAALDIRRSWIVEAPAGSGKTGLLIQRFLKLLAFGEVERPSEVMAITFTRKAAAELRNRVLEQLAAAAADAPFAPNAGAYERVTRDLALGVLARDRALGWHLLQTPHGLNIGTIDAFCAELAGSRPLLSAGAGRYQPVDDPGQLYEQAAERTVRELGGAETSLNEALRTLLLHRDGQIGDVIQLLAGMLGAREQWGELVPLDQTQLTDELLDSLVRPRLEATLEKAICTGLAQAADALGPELLNELAQLAHRLSAEPGYNGAPSPLAPCSAFPHTPENQAAALDHWLTLLHLLLTKSGDWRSGFKINHIFLKLPKAEEQRLKDLIAALREADDRQPGLKNALCAVRGLPPSRYPEVQWHIVKALFRVLRHALVELNVLFAERGQCDFTEIALAARTLLRSDTDLLATPAAHLTHLLVDEMQDTSAGQYELLERLTHHWDGATQTVFLVGDPKQSIYLFRQARVARFLRTQATGLLGDLPLQALRLTANFRSQSCLVDQFNNTFSRILSPPEKSYAPAIDRVEVPFVAAISTRAAGVDPALHWHTRLMAKEDAVAGNEEFRPQPADPGTGEDARTVRTLIEKFTHTWHADLVTSGRTPRPPRIAVLARARAHLAPVIAEFQRDRGRGPLPFRAIEIELLNERPEVLDLLALTRALLHPGDRIAWLAILRSPVCGLELADLLALCGEGENADPAATVPYLVQTRAHHLSPEGQSRLQRIWNTLSDAQAAFGRTTFSTLVERTWRSLGADAFLRPDQRTNAGRFLSLLRKLEAGAEPLSLALLERALRKLYAEPLADPHAIELLTIHKAKGLEWDLVLVPALHRDTGNNRHDLLRWLELDGDRGAEAEIILSPIAGKGEESSRLSKWLGTLQAAREAEEAKRLFYVACTRAREEVHLFTACSMKKDGSLSVPRPNTLLRAAWPAAEPVLSYLLTFQASSPPLVQVIEENMPLALAAAAEVPLSDPIGRMPKPLQVQRLSENFHPLDRFHPDRGPRIPYPSAQTLRTAVPFLRPEGSFATRAFGNVVHRFLDILAGKLARGESAETLLRDLPTWHKRLVASCRAEGLPAALSAREADRARLALETTLRDSLGSWILSPHTDSRSERSLQVSAENGGAPGRLVRADRTFLAGPEPSGDGTQTHPQTHLWIVDFKTAEQGGRSRENFLANEKLKYEPQMHAYAQAMLCAGHIGRPIVLALFYPLLPHLLYWPLGA